MQRQPTPFIADGGPRELGLVENLFAHSGGGLGFHGSGSWLGQGKRPSVIHLEKSSGQLLGRQVANLANWLDCKNFLFSQSNKG
jgi:hypothetical protein